MNVISSLKIVAAKRPNQQPQIVRRRNKLINALHDQLQLASVQAEGREYLKTRRRHIKNPATGEYVEAVISRKPRAWYWTDDHAKVYISSCYGTRILKLSKGKYVIEVGDVKQLVPMIEALKRAVAARGYSDRCCGE